MSTDGGQGDPRALHRAREALERLDADLRTLGAAARGEVFARCSQRLRVEVGDDVAVRRGTEEGTAVRVLEPDGTLRFGACSGRGRGATLEAHALARGVPPAQGPPWADPPAEPLLDLDGEAALPDPEAAEAWLRRALGDAGPPARARLDAAVILEVLGTTDGLRACRVRGLLWARRIEGVEVRSAVARRFGRLDAADWGTPAPSVPAPRAGRRHAGPVALLPGAAGPLAAALVAAVHPGGTAVEVGPGWRCEDDPADPEALGGWTFDDAGFTAGPLRLADGRRILGVPEGPGYLRRDSFRTPPRARATQIRFASSGSWGGDGLMARSVRLWVSEGGWDVLLDAAPARNGRPVEPWAPWIVHGPPELWVATCAAGVGAVRRTPEGVSAPTLVFDGLPPAVRA